MDGHDLLWPDGEAVGWAVGELWCEERRERVSMWGEAALFLEGRIGVQGQARYTAWFGAGPDLVDAAGP